MKSDSLLLLNRICEDKLMKLLSKTIATIIIVILSGSFASFAESPKTVENKYKNILQIHSWKINDTLGLDQAVQKYNLRKYERKFSLYGYFVSFKDNMTFESNYRASCGNDPFKGRTTKGNYKFMGADEIMITPEKVSYSGNFSESAKDGRLKELTYSISEDEGGIVFTKVE